MGIVERFGPKQVSGWVECRAHADRQIAIKVNDFTVATTQVCRPVRFNGEIRDFGFARRVNDLWNYIGEGDAVSLEYSGEKIPILRHGYHYHPPCHAVSTFDELKRKIEQGYIFDKRGRLAPAWNRRDHTAAFEAFEKISRIVKSEFGYDLFIFYGTLLGCVREGDFIAHDNDLDFAYISRHCERDLVAAEFQRLCALLIDHGFYGTLYRHGFGIKSPVSLDIYYTWFDSSNLFQASFGYHGDAIPFGLDFSASEEKTLGPFKVRVPNAADRILEQLYGPTWRTPNPGFSHYSRNRKIPIQYLLSLSELSRLHWKQVYARWRSDVAVAESGLAREATARLFDRRRLIVDLGCGAGVDALHFSRAGHEVAALDASPEAIALACRSAKAEGLDRCSFSTVNLEDSKALTGFLRQQRIEAAAKGAGIVIYVQQVLEFLSAEAERRLFDLLREYCGPYELLAEVKVVSPRLVASTTAQFFARTMPAEDLASRLRNYGLTSVTLTEGPSATDTDDEPTYRVVGTTSPTQ